MSGSGSGSWLDKVSRHPECEHGDPKSFIETLLPHGRLHSQLWMRPRLCQLARLELLFGWRALPQSRGRLPL